MTARALLISSHVANGVCTVTLQDESRRNALSRRLVQELNAAFDEAESDPSVRVIVVTNSGTVFCAGADLSERSSTNSANKPGPSSTNQSDPLTLFTRIPRSPKPYVGRIAGHCVAGGMGLAAAMDFSVAIDDVKMGFTEVRIGVAPAMISVLCLPKMSKSDAQEAFLRGRRFTGSEAARIGLVNTAVPADQLDDVVATVVGDLLLAGPNALAVSKRLIAEVPSMDVEQAFRWTGKLSGELFGSDEAKAGMSAYLEKRAAPWIPTTSWEQ